ncbi:MAG TPA: hypothetical protein VFR06_03040 [Gallionellaceae bacterium]|nr:hypothetical protein [Gallionellaceae bacterium]
MNTPLRLLLCLLLLCNAPLHAAELGRLFFTPEQREQLELGQLRGNTAGDGSSATLTVNGIVQKRGGKRTVWINGIPQSDLPANEQKPASTSVRVPGKGKTVEIKVGQKLLLDQSNPPAAESPAP